MNHPFTIITLIFFLAACKEPQPTLPLEKNQPLISFVNPFIGTGGHGHTYPGATMPFGMVQLSPDTRLEGWDGCSGYHYSDQYIYGFSHTHLSGTGVSDYGDILLMPTTSPQFNNGADGNVGYKASFNHNNEYASPGYYEVLLDSTNIKVQLTVTQRAGYHKYQFANAQNQWVILDLEHRDKVLSSNIEIVSNTQIKGHRFSEAWAKDQRVFFYMEFSHPFNVNYQKSEDTTKGKKVAINFSNPNNDPIFAKVGLSAVSEESAKNNLIVEIGAKSFQEIKNLAQEIWEKQLEKIIVQSPSNDYKTNFYTALYHTMLAPNIYQDVDGRYRGMDLEIHQADFNYYTVFSLWDTYRATHPLYTIIEQDRTTDFINTMIAKYKEGGIIPIWDLAANYTGCMIGYHGIPVIADAYLKGIKGYDAEMAFKAMKHSAMQNHLGLKYYQEMGFIPIEEESESVSKTLEYAYDDWAIAQMAKALNKTEDYNIFIKRAQNYKNLYDPETCFFRGRFRNTWFNPFDPFEVNFNYTEANAWQYSLYAPQDISGHINLMGGKEKFENHLNKLFTVNSKTSGRDQADITGLIGQYAHGNEPSHHMAYLYNFVNKPYKTQEKVHQILTTLYKNMPDGISGNEDCGQMSAWYVFSSLGFYPVTPGSNQYIIGSPLFEKATINLENGKQFTIVAENISDKNIYIQKAFLNGTPLNQSFINHNNILQGGNLVFKMGPQPSNWATKEGFEPKTEIINQPITLAPYIEKGEIAFKDSTLITLQSAQKEAKIFFKTNHNNFQKYTKPIVINENSTLMFYAQVNNNKSKILTTSFYKINPNLSITLKAKYANQYNGGGKNALIDGIKGVKDFKTGAWQGYQNTDFEAIIDLGKTEKIAEININFLQDQRSWIFYPKEVTFSSATDTLNFNKPILIKISEAGNPDENINIKTITYNPQNKPIRYLKIKAKNFGNLPSWHLGYPYQGKAWIFVDEVEIKKLK